MIEIIVVNCNNGENLKRCIQSIKDNTSDCKIICIDQNSKDGTKEWLQENVGHIILDKKRNGRSDGKNKCLKVSYSDWIAIVDADIEIKDKDWLDKMWNFTGNNRVGFIEAEVITMYEDKPLKVFGGLACCLIRRTCLNEVGYFDSRILHGGEYDWLTRLEWSGWWIEYCAGTNIVNSTGRGMNGCFEWNLEKFRMELLKSLGFKYTMNFLEQTIIKNILRRNSMRRELLEDKNGYSDRNSVS
jgi:GT2 family glycosyltransferase